MNDLPFTAATAWGEPGGSNLPEYSVSELSLALKRSIEDGFGQVRVRGEISGYKRHGSGHKPCLSQLRHQSSSLSHHNSQNISQFQIRNQSSQKRQRT